VPLQLGVVARLLNEGEEQSAQDALELFIEVAEAHPRFLRRHLTEVAAAMLQVRRQALVHVCVAQCVRGGWVCRTMSHENCCNLARVDSYRCQNGLVLPEMSEFPELTSEGNRVHDAGQAAHRWGTLFYS